MTVATRRVRPRVGLHYVKTGKGRTKQKVCYRAGDGNSFETNDPMILNDRIKFEILNDDGTSLSAPARSPFERRSNESDDQFLARMEELAAAARNAMNSVQPKQDTGKAGSTQKTK